MKNILYLFLAVTIFACSSDDSSDTNDNNNPPNNCDVVYLDSNGVTIKACPDAQVGQSGEINGITYTIVNASTLYDMASSGDDLSRVCTSRIISMANLFLGNGTNPNIESWDVSNVNNMFGMFQYSNMDVDLGKWDVSNVTNMSQMFYAETETRPNIGDWDVSNVTNMSRMFYNNQSIADLPIEADIDMSSWNVANVIDCSEFARFSPLLGSPFMPNFTNCTP